METTRDCKLINDQTACASWVAVIDNMALLLIHHQI